MKNHRIYWECGKKHSKRIVTATLLAGALVLPSYAEEAELLALADSARDAYSVLSASVPSADYPNGVLQLIDHTSLYDLQTNASIPTFLHHRAPDYANENERGLAIEGDAFLVVFSW